MYVFFSFFFFFHVSHSTRVFSSFCLCQLPRCAIWCDYCRFLLLRSFRCDNMQAILPFWTRLLCATLRPVIFLKIDRNQATPRDRILWKITLHSKRNKAWQLGEDNIICCLPICFLFFFFGLSLFLFFILLVGFLRLMCESFIDFDGCYRFDARLFIL